MKTYCCAMCDQTIKVDAFGKFDPPHKTARYCLRCFGRITLIVQTKLEQERKRIVEGIEDKQACVVDTEECSGEFWNGLEEALHVVRGES